MWLGGLVADSVLIIVLDTNAFHGDAGAKLPFERVLDGATNGDFEVVIPEVVIQELVRQYPERLREARKTPDSSLGRDETAECPTQRPTDHR